MINKKGIKDSTSVLLKKYLKKRRVPTFSQSYLLEQSCHSQRLRAVFYELLSYEPSGRGTSSEVVKLLETRKHIFYFPLSISQATAIEKHDEKLIVENFNFEEDIDLPSNDGTNSCSYLSLGIVDHFASSTCKKIMEKKFVSDVESIIEEFPKRFNQVRNIKSMPDIHDAYKLLSRSNLLKNEFEFIECFVDNYAVYTYEFQNQFLMELRNLKSSAASKDRV